ncbi:MAG: FecR family protein, partial [Thermodesulfobacteriota bacterium]
APAAAAAAAAAPPAAGTAEGDRLAQVFFKEVTPPTDLLPAGVRLAPGFEPGSGEPIGAVEMTVGRAWIVHLGANVAYDAGRERPLFAGDTLVTGEKAQLKARLNDRSSFAMAGHTKMVLDKAVYDPDQDRRTSVLQVLFGRARFLVNRLKGGYDQDFEVRTPTAICGVRGSDFAIAVLPEDAATAQEEGWRQWLAELLSVRSAHALVGGALVTTVLTGTNTTVGFSGLVGGMQTLGSGMLSTAAMGGAATGGLGVSAGVMGGALNGIGAGLGAATAMPPALE